MANLLISWINTGLCFSYFLEYVWLFLDDSVDEECD